jgi:hypothetical protein
MTTSRKMHSFYMAKFFNCKILMAGTVTCNRILLHLFERAEEVSLFRNFRRYIIYMTW